MVESLPRGALAIASVDPLAVAGPSRANELLRKNLLLAIATLVSSFLVLAALEVGFRAFGAGAPDAALNGLHAYSEIYGWAPRPGSRLVGAGGVTTINDQGYRGTALPPAKNKRRVVLLGDSIAFGLGVHDSETFSEVLQAGHSGLEVANLAVQGFGPGQELARLEHEGLALRPDVVLVATCLSNDFADAMLPVFLYDGAHPKLHYRIEDDQLVKYDAHLQLPRTERLGVFLRTHSRLFGMMSGPRDPLADNGGSGWGNRKQTALKDRAKAIALTARLLAAMAERSRAAGAEFVVLAFPDREEFDGATRWGRALVRSPAVLGVPIVDMARRFRSAGLGFDDFATDKIGHLSPQGHRETARILAQLLKLPDSAL